MKYPGSYKGRGGHNIFYCPDGMTVRKEIPNSRGWEPAYMRAQPRSFCHVTKVQTQVDNKLCYWMPRLVEPDLVHDGQAILFRGIYRLKLLWGQEAQHPTDWREGLIEHLQEINDRFQVESNEDIARYVKWFVCRPHGGLIHGDPTLANMLYDEQRNGWVWIDPLIRDFIPNDPHVDLGKMFQSCWGYEAILAGSDEIHFNKRLACELARVSGLDYSIGRAWCWVHFIRLLPYQRKQDVKIFKEILKCFWSST